MQGLIDKYANDSEYVFPIIDTSLSTSIYDQYRLALGRVNRYLKKITFRLNINVRLTTYTARHTWATLARESGAPISIISAGLGHTSEEMTRVYLKEFDQETLARVNRIVTNLLFVKLIFITYICKRYLFCNREYINRLIIAMLQNKTIFCE